MRHTLDVYPSPFEVKRKLGRVQLHADRLLDLRDDAVLELIGIKPSDLVSDDIRACADVAQLAQEAGARGIIAPSVGLPGRITFVIFAPFLKSAVRLEAEKVQRLPVTIADHAGYIRPVPEASPSVARLLRELERGGRRLARRLRG